MSVNDHPTYFGFLSVACDYYKALGHKVHVAYVSKNTNLEVNCDSLLRLDPGKISKGLLCFTNEVR